MSGISFVAFWLAIALYAGATVLYAYQVATKRVVLSKYATLATGLGFILHTASIGFRSVATHGTQLNGSNVLVLMAWALVLVYFVVEHLIRVKVYGTLLVPASLLLLLLAQLMGESRGVLATMPPDQARLVDNWRIGIHVFLIAFANAGYAIGATASLLYVVLERQLKRHKRSTFLSRLPSLAQTDAIARRAIQLSFPIYTVGLLLGVLRAIDTDVNLWWADLRVVLAGVVWAVYGAYIFLRWRKGLTGRRAAYFSLAGFVLVAIVAVVARTVPSGFHVFGL